MTESKARAGLRGLVWLALVPLVARADSAGAEALFERGKALMGEGRVAEACAKFEESYRLDPGGGVLMNVATCHEKLGRTATAWASYKEALVLAVKAGRADREQFARERIEALEKQLPRLVVDVPAAARVPGLEVRRAGVLLGAGSWGEALPVDPGPHHIEAQAPGHRARSYDVVARAGESITLRVEPLDAQPAAPVASGPASAIPAASTTPEPAASPLMAPPGRSQRRVAGYVVGGAGFLSLWVGGVFGVRAILKRQDSDSDCPGGACNARGWASYEQAQTAANVANVGLALGVIGVGVGTWLVLSSRNETTLTAGPSGVAVRGAW